MKLVLSQSQMASAQNQVILMYEFDGHKVVKSIPAGSTFEVDDEEALAILATPHLKGVVSIEGSKKSMASAPRNKSVI